MEKPSPLERLVQLAIVCCIVFLTVLTCSQVRAQPLTGFYVGPVVGHMQTGATVHFPNGTQINDVGGNTPLVGVMGGWSRSIPYGPFVAVEAWGFLPVEAYPTTITNASIGYEVSNKWEIAANVRLGWTIRDSAAVYGLLGVSTSHATFQVNGSSYARTGTTPFIGVGSEISLARRWSLRTDFTFDRQRFDVGPYSVNAQVRWRWTLALAYRF